MNLLITNIGKEIFNSVENKITDQHLKPIEELIPENKVEATNSKISSSFVCKLGIHKWNGCTCKNCGKYRNKYHNFSDDCEKCSVCGKEISESHAWNGCKCKKCNKTRDSEHKTNGGSTCLNCGKSVKSADFNNVVNLFIKTAMDKSAYCSIAISELGTASSDLAQAFMKSGISASHVTELLNTGLLAICPMCHDYISGQALLMLDTLALAGSVVFTGNSGGAERLMEGKCKSYSCFSKTYDLYWCPDLDPIYLSDIQTRHGLSIDRYMQEKRQHIWKPSR
ncbi:MAG: hypothetical protein IPH88_17160 [Bacteroidales bacterium]|nr:hypothetical protein [Bacteroidales bacterium]